MLIFMLTFRWDPTSSRLALCTANDKLYLWSPSGSVSVQVPLTSTFHIHSLRWHRNGQSLLLMSKEQFCICYLEDTKPVAAEGDSRT